MAFRIMKCCILLLPGNVFVLLAVLLPYFLQFALGVAKRVSSTRASISDYIFWNGGNPLKKCWWKEESVCVCCLLQVCDLCSIFTCKLCLCHHWHYSQTTLLLTAPCWTLVLQELLSSGASAGNVLQRIIHFHAIIHLKIKQICKAWWRWQVC